MEIEREDEQNREGKIVFYSHVRLSLHLLF